MISNDNYKIFFLLLFIGFTTCKGQSNNDFVISYLPKSQLDLIQKGYKNSGHGFSRNIYKKVINDTSVWYYYPSEQSKYYKVVRIYFSDMDSFKLSKFYGIYNYKSNKDSLSIVVDNKTIINYKVYFAENKKYVELLYIHPSYKNYNTNRNNDIEPSN
jgi:hypothetical protein